MLLSFSEHIGRHATRNACVVTIAALLMLCACGKPDADNKSAAKADTDSPLGVSLSAAEVKSLGIATVPAAVASYRQQITGYGVVAALDVIAQADADVRTAQAAAAQSQAAAGRAQSLATGEEAAVSREIVETTQSKAATDQAALTLARRKAEATFGRTAPWQDAASRQAIMARLASGRTVLVRVTFPMGSVGNEKPKNLQIARLGNGAKTWTANAVWDAPADPTLPGRGFYALVDGSDLAQNEHVTVAIPSGTAQSGYSIPAAALIYGESAAWFYVQPKPGMFIRIKIDPDKPLGDGYFVGNSAGLHAGQAVVVNGAGLLLNRETNPSPAAGD